MAERDRDDDVVVLLTAGRDREAARRGAALAGSRPLHRAGGHMHPLVQFQQLGPVLGEVIAQIGPDQLERPTPCDDFTVRGVLEHMIGGATMFAAAYRGEAPAPRPVDDPRQAVQLALGELAASIGAPGALDRSIQAPFGAVDGETFARFVVLDGLVHGWDLATATGQRYEPPSALVAAASDFAHQALDALRDGQTFKDAVQPPVDATPMERLAAYTGRRDVRPSS